MDFSAVVATSNPFRAYDGIMEMPRGLLEEIARAINDGRMPMLGHHDQTRPLRMKELVAEVRPTQHGTFEVRVVGLVAAEDWEALQGIRGMSVSFGAPLEPELWPRAAQPALILSADKAWFDDAALVQALHETDATLRTLVDNDELGIVGNRLFQFSVVPDPKIVIDVTAFLMASLGWNLLASVIWDGVKTLWARRRTPKNGRSDAPTVIDIHVQNGEKEITAVVRTSDQEVARAAIEAVSEGILITLEDSPRPTIRWVDDQNDPLGNGGRWVEVI